MWNTYYGSYEYDYSPSGCDLAHSWVNTGTKVTWCKVCNTDGHFDGILGKYVITKDRTKEHKLSNYTDMD